MERTGHSPSRRTLLSAALLSCLELTVPRRLAQAAPASEPARLIRALVDEAFVILRDPELARDRSARMQKLRDAADKAFDWLAMAQSSLGHHWRKLEPEQRARFVLVFKELLARQYMEDLDRFRGTEQVQILETVAKDDLRVVKTILITAGRERIPMDYTLYAVNDRWLVNDLSIEGVSPVSHYRQSFNRFLVNKGFDELMRQLERKLGRS
jgi:phospholipid transport system substrate-binding protein